MKTNQELNAIMAKKGFRPFYNYQRLYVTKTGFIQEAALSNGSVTPTIKKLKIHTDDVGRTYIQPSKWQKLYVDVLVLSCWHKKLDTEPDYVIHIDGDNSNNIIDNLRWGTNLEFINANKKKFSHIDKKTGEEWRLVNKKDKLYVSEKGKVKENGKELTAQLLIFDPDLDCERAVCCSYVVRSHSRDRLYVEQLVAKMFCQDPPKNMVRPSILHLDNDYTNNAATNLRWVEGSSQEYQVSVFREGRICRCLIYSIVHCRRIDWGEVLISLPFNRSIFVVKNMFKKLSFSNSLYNFFLIIDDITNTHLDNMKFFLN